MKKRKTFKKLSFKNQITTITGSLPGVGKSVVSRSIFGKLRNEGYNVVLCATTKRASTTTGKTASSALGCYVKFPEGKNERVPKRGFEFVNPTYHPNLEKIFIVDEAMLWSEEKWRVITNCYPKCKFILIGDSLQFEPVDGYKSLSKSSISLEWSFRQTEKEYLDFLTSLKNGDVDVNYIENNFLEKKENLKYIDTCYTISKEKNLDSEAKLYFSKKDNDFIYSLNGKKFFKLSTNERTIFDLVDEKKYVEVKGIHMHLLQGLTLDEKLGLKIHIDDCLSNPFFYDIFVRYLFVSCSRTKNKRQIYIPRSEFEKLKAIVQNKPNLEKNENDKESPFKTDSDFVLRMTANEILDLFDEKGFNLEKDSHDYFMTDSERDNALEERFHNSMKMLWKQPWEMYAPVNPLNRKSWKKEKDDVPGCKSHHWYLFEIDYPKGKTDLIPEMYMQKIKEKYIDPNKELFFCIVYSGKNSYHCYFYNESELDEKHYGMLWDAINKEIFDGLCDKAKRCYNASLGRLPFAKRYDTGKWQSLESLTANAYSYDESYVERECKIEVEKPVFKFKEAAFTDSDRDSIEKEKAWIRNTWSLTTADGTNRWKKLCSIVSETSSWSHRTLTNEALVQVYWDIGMEMNLSEQRINAAIRKMNRRYVKVIGNDKWEESRNKRKNFQEQNDRFIESECQSVYEKYGLKSALEVMYLLFDFSKRKSHTNKINKNLSIVKINKEFENYLSSKNFHFDNDIMSVLNDNDISLSLPRTRSVPTVKPIGKTNDLDNTGNNPIVGSSLRTEGSCETYIKLEPNDYKLFEAIQLLTAKEIRAILRGSKILSCTKSKEEMKKLVKKQHESNDLKKKVSESVIESNKKNKTEFKRNEKIMKDYQNGMKQKDIAKKYKLNKSRVSQILKKLSA